MDLFLNDGAVCTVGGQHGKKEKKRRFKQKGKGGSSLSDDTLDSSLGFLCMPNFENKSYPVQVIPDSGKASDLFHLLSDKTRLSPADIGVFYTLAGILIPLMTNTTVCRTKEITERTKEYLIQHPFAKTSELAKNCTISEAALYSAFRKSYDITLHQLKNNLLLEKAKDMLITTDKPIEYISYALQFSSTSYFRKKFKHHFNITPTEMRKLYRI